jgi:hypothetical protein
VTVTPWSPPIASTAMRTGDSGVNPVTP